MKYIFCFLLSFVFLNLKAQLPTGVPTQKINGWIENWYTVPDSGAVITKRDTSWRPRFPGTMVTWFHAGVDTLQWFWNGAKWGKVVGAAANLSWQQTLNNSSVLTKDNSIVADGFNWKWHNTDEFGVFKEQYDVANSLYYICFAGADVSADSTVLRLAHEDGEALIGHLGNLGSQIVFANPQEASIQFNDVTSSSTSSVSTLFQNVNLLSSRGIVPISTHQINIVPDSIEIRGDTTGARRLKLRLTGLPISSSSTDSQLVVNSSGRVAKRATVGGGTVTSVGLTMPTAFTVTSTSTNPITTSGTFNVTANGTSSQYIKGNGVLGTTDTSMIPSFFTKVRSLFSGTSPITYSASTGAIGINIADVSGTLGAATFSGSDFSTNGSGLISIKPTGLGSGSCSPCKVSFTSTGLASSFATDPVSNGLALNGDSIQLGQTIGAGGAPATLTHNTEIPMSVYDLRLINVGASNRNAFRLYAASSKGDSIPFISFNASDGTELIRINGDAANLFIGNKSGINATLSAGANIFVGGGLSGNALTSGSDNTAVGWNALSSVTTGRDNMAYGRALFSLTTGTGNLGMGYTSLLNLTTGSFNIAIGGDHILQAALQQLQTGNNNIAIGNAAIGEAGTTTNNASDRIAIGFKVYNRGLLGYKSIAIGDSTGNMPVGSVTGIFNVFLGGNIFDPNGAAKTVGDSNVIVGSNAGFTSNFNMGNGNVLIGANNQWGASFSNSIMLGYGMTNNISNIVRIGRSDQNVIVGVTSNQADNGYRHQVYGSGFFSDSVKIGNMPTGATTDSVLVSRNGVVYKVLQSSLATGTIYVSDGTLTGNRTLSGANKILTFDTLNYFRLNAFSQVFSWPDKTTPYTASIIAGPKNYQIGYTPTALVYSKGAGLYIDTNNNAGLGTFPNTAAPLYATGSSASVSGFQSVGSNFYRVDSVVTSQSLNLAEYFIRVNASGGAVTLTLPSAATAFGANIGIVYKIQKIDASGNAVTISRAGSDTINGATSQTISSQYDIHEVQCTSTTTWGYK